MSHCHRCLAPHNALNHTQSQVDCFRHVLMVSISSDEQPQQKPCRSLPAAVLLVLAEQRGSSEKGVLVVGPIMLENNVKTRPLGAVAAPDSAQSPQGRWRRACRLECRHHVRSCAPPREADADEIPSAGRDLRQREMHSCSSEHRYSTFAPRYRKRQDD